LLIFSNYCKGPRRRKSACFRRFSDNQKNREVKPLSPAQIIQLRSEENRFRGRILDTFFSIQSQCDISQRWGRGYLAFGRELGTL
jgi:hypothetical protein